MQKNCSLCFRTGNEMRVVCRADASYFLGAGHVMRLLTLASAIRDQGGDALFLTRAHLGHLAHVIQDCGFEVKVWDVESDGILGGNIIDDAQNTRREALRFQATYIFVDHYGVNASWELAQPCPVLVIEDLFTRKHNCAILLNQNLGVKSSDYASLVSDNTICLMGPDYALLRPEFAKLRSKALAKRDAGPVCEILVAMGGTDQPNATGWVLEALAGMDLSPDLHLTIVMGPTAPHLGSVQDQAASLPFRTTVLVGTTQMGALMVKADLAIGAAGSTSWERCALGLPAIIVILAENQRAIAQALELAQAAIMLEMGQDKVLKQAVTAMFSSQSNRSKMSRIAAQICDARGTKRVLKVLQKGICNDE